MYLATRGTSTLTIGVNVPRVRSGALPLPTRSRSDELGRVLCAANEVDDASNAPRMPVSASRCPHATIPMSSSAPASQEVSVSHALCRPYAESAVRASSAGVPLMMVRACSVTISSGQSHQAAFSSSSTSASLKRERITRAGLPATIA